MPGNFHEREYDEATLLKLEIFRGYIREWIPVFLSRKSFSTIHIYDFFSGPGSDASGNLGSPMLILDELVSYLKNSSSPVSPDVDIHLHFNDVDPSKILQLRSNVENRLKGLSLFAHFTTQDFENAFIEAAPNLLSAASAKLLFIDQFGIKAVSGEVFRRLLECRRTDVLFFISSGYVRRFGNEESFQRYIPLPSEILRAWSPKEVHRRLCTDFYRPLIPENVPYHLAPFSIQKGTNFYGIIFGSAHLLGLEKFLRVCWDQDSVTGEANYDIDDDIIRSGQGALFPEDNVIRKHDKFQRELRQFLSQEWRDNRAIYQFTLESGFLPRHATPILKQLRQEGLLRVEQLDSAAAHRQNTYYLTWEAYREPARLRIRVVEVVDGI